MFAAAGFIPFCSFSCTSLVRPVAHNKDNKKAFSPPSLVFVWMSMMSLSLSQRASTNTALPYLSPSPRDGDELGKYLAVLQPLN